MNRRIAIGAVLGLVLCAAARPARGGTDAPEPVVTTQRLDRAADSVLAQPVYAWRMSRSHPLWDDLRGPEHRSSFWGAFFRDLRERIERVGDTVRRWMRSLRNWLRGAVPESDPDRPKPGDWTAHLHALTFVLMAVTSGLLAVLLLRMWRRRRAARIAVVAQPVLTAASLLDDNVTAGEAPTSEWVRLAQELLANAEYRLAVRAMFLAGLAFLGDAGQLALARHKSNREYACELARKAHDRPDMLEAFAANLRLVERVWYGRHPATREDVDRFQADQKRVLAEGRAPESTSGGAS